MDMPFYHDDYWISSKTLCFYFPLWGQVLKGTSLGYVSKNKHSNNAK